MHTFPEVYPLLNNNELCADYATNHVVLGVEFLHGHLHSHARMGTQVRMGISMIIVPSDHNITATKFAHFIIHLMACECWLQFHYYFSIP